MQKTHDKYKVKAEYVDDGGAGVGWLPEDTQDQKAGYLHKVHVPGLLPGEEALVVIQHRSPHTGEAYGVMTHRYSAAANRVDAVCKAYGYCGSCVLQHLCYSAQLDLKKQWLENLCSKENIRIESILQDCVPAPSEGLYGRRQVKYVVGKVKDQVILGSYQPRSHQIVDMQGCRLIRASLAAIAQTICDVATKIQLSVYDEANRKGSLRYVLLRESFIGEVQLTLVLAELGDLAAWAVFSKEVCGKHTNLVSVICHQNQEMGNAIFSKDGREWLLSSERYLWEPIGAINARLSARSFVQANATVAQAMYQIVAQELDPKPDDCFLDLYCGVGGIGWTVWQKEKDLRFVGIEENPYAIEDAKATRLHNHIPEHQAQFFCQEAERFPKILSLCQNPEQISLVALNPPRKGASALVLSHITALLPRAIAYVSCNPETLLRDLKILGLQGYHLTKLIPFDLHPHTHHVEVIAILKRR